MGVRSMLVISRSLAERAIMDMMSRADDGDVGDALEAIMGQFACFSNFRISNDPTDDHVFEALLLQEKEERS